MKTSSRLGSPRCQRCAPSAFLAEAIALSSALLVAPADMQLGAERRHHVDAVAHLQLLGERVQVGARDDPGAQARLRDHLIGRAAGQQLAIGDIGDLVAALGLVHIVGGDEHGDAFGGQPVDLLPELSPRLGIDAGGRLVEQEQLRLTAGCRRRAQAAASSPRRACRQAGRRAVESPSRATASFAAPPWIGDAVHAGHELQILADGEILIEAEALGHVADVALDLVGLG